MRIADWGCELGGHKKAGLCGARLFCGEMGTGCNQPFFSRERIL